MTNSDCILHGLLWLRTLRYPEWSALLWFAQPGQAGSISRKRETAMVIAVQTVGLQTDHRTFLTLH